jgi:hypothetical protein
VLRFHTAIDAPNPLKGANVEYGDGVLMIEAFKQEGNTANTQVPEH